jgi:peroxiredoxin
MPETLKAGDTAPDFELMNQDKKHIKLTDFRGKKKVALLFYPMDFSPTCTQEHCTFGPEMTKLSPDGETVIFGVNADSPFTHAAYRKQYNIPYDLLSDPTRRMIKAYGMFAGEEPYNCAKRGTVVIDKTGKITFYQEVPMKEPRKVAELALAISES